MELGQTISLNYSYDQSKRSSDSISILVVDDDITCLSIVAATLKKFNYEVVTVKHPNDALCALRIKGDAFDLVVSDVHMPDMNGFELKEAIAHEFNLPVVLMSADNKEGVVSRGLEIGAVFFISKPVSPDDVRDLWQFASIKKKSQVVNTEAVEKEIASANQNNSDDQMHLVSTLMVNKWKNNKKDPKRKSPSKEEGCDERREENGTGSNSMKKKKVIWTNALHNRFLEAIRSIGLDRSVPKKILEVMNVPGLTRENVASHLQKYRIFLRRVSEASYKFHYVDDHKGLNSSFASSRTSLSDIFSKPHYQQNPASLLKPSITHSNLTHHPSIRISQNTYPIFQGHLSNASLQGHNDMSFDHASMNYMGYKISNIKHLAQSGSCREYESTDSFNGTMNVHQNYQFQNSSTINGAANLLSDNTLNLVQPAPILGSSSSYEPENTEGKQLLDVSSNYQNLSLLGNLGNEGLIHESPALSPMYHLSTFDNFMEGDDLDYYFSDQVNIQNQAQQINEGENTTGKNWDNHSSSYDQAAPNQHEDDDFLEALLALGSFGEDQIQTLEGI